VLGLYIHIPFCQHICSYCNFNRGLLDAELKVKYIDALEREIRTSGVVSCPPGLARETTPDVLVADTIFFGGGTPSLLEPAEIARILRACRETYTVTPDAEITLETNPETVTPERLAAFRDAGINRLSFGVQSFDNDELKKLGRIHSAEKAIEVIGDAMGLGFASVSFDLMLWLPGQTPATWYRTVDQAISLSPDHLSLYLLELYPNAPLKEEMARSGWSQTPDDDAAEMYLEGLRRLDAAGYSQYEISNVSRQGHRSRHNVKYWQSGDWRGFGCGAHSTVAGTRWRNLSGTAEYVARVTAGADVRQDVRVLSAAERVEEALFTGLRLNEGIDEAAFHMRWGIFPWERYRDALEVRIESGHVWRMSGRFGLTREGMLVANDVLAAFV
jgi:oxygen-independent coproporphyrinogen III oxidase